ncbi:hypothetical protein NEIFL0001_2251 [Neisseria flavescens SK114]|nr:hypothetical protein NEIFL0001_2251 [Neisseria flavescens SK114]
MMFRPSETRFVRFRRPHGRLAVSLLQTARLFSSKDFYHE